MEYKIILEEGTGEIEEKKSRFICTLRPIASEEEAQAFIDEMKKKYWDARHNCSAFVLGKRQEVTRCSDDGEPSGTAGRPMLEVLLGEGLCDTAAVVTRYFGGTLLGTGGLVRAYTQAVKEAIGNTPVGTMCFGTRLRIGTDYNGIGKIQYIIGKNGLTVLHSDYGADVSLQVLVPQEEVEHLKKELTEATGGQAKLENEEELFFLKQ